MFRKLFSITLVLGLLAGLTQGTLTTAMADCQDTGDVGDGSGGDIITCDNDPGADADGYTAGAGNDQITIEAGAIVGDGVGLDDIKGSDGDDTITNNGSVDDDIFGDSGDDTITNNGTVGDDLAGGDDDDTITNNGTVKDDIWGNDGDDTITNSGTVEDGIYGLNGDDIVTLTGTQPEVSGTIDGGEGEEDEGGDTLNFNMSTSDQDEFDTASAAINTAIGNGHADGNFAWNGGTITWVNFETLLNNLIGPVVLVEPVDAPAADDDTGGATPTTVYSDDNVRVSQDGSGALHFYAENGASDHLIVSVSQSDYSSAGAGQVLVTVVDDELGVLLYVEARGNGQIVVQYYSTADGSLLSSTVITI